MIKKNLTANQPTLSLITSLIRNLVVLQCAAVRGARSGPASPRRACRETVLYLLATYWFESTESSK